MTRHKTDALRVKAVSLPSRTLAHLASLLTPQGRSGRAWARAAADVGPVQGCFRSVGRGSWGRAFIGGILQACRERCKNPGGGEECGVQGEQGRGLTAVGEREALRMATRVAAESQQERSGAHP